MAHRELSRDEKELDGDEVYRYLPRVGTTRSMVWSMTGSDHLFPLFLLIAHINDLHIALSNRGSILWSDREIHEIGKKVKGDAVGQWFRADGGKQLTGTGRSPRTR